MFLHANHSFIIRIMIEPCGKPGAPIEWKGMIQYVASGERMHFRNLEEIPVIIQRILNLALERNEDSPPPGNKRNFPANR